MSGRSRRRHGRARYRLSAAVVRVQAWKSPLALYRRYRPETFAEVIGQDHVTGPLRAALANNRVNHAYLFSGPRGCGKTTVGAHPGPRAQLRAGARSPTRAASATSCRDLARGGPGSIDVIEIDAASPRRRRRRPRPAREGVLRAGAQPLQGLHHRRGPHGHARRASTPCSSSSRSRRRTCASSSPPPSPRRCIADHPLAHPPLPVPADPAAAAVGLPRRAVRAARACAIEPAALPLVVRAGAGSARDTLSVLDQLIGGAGPEGVTYALATGLLGYTPDTLLDEVVDAFAAGDGAAVFGVVDKVIETGQDPRRFTEDLLRRLRDLVIVAAVPDAPATGLIDVARGPGRAARRPGRPVRPRRAEPGRRPGRRPASPRCAGATAPRLLLELICARVLLPGADHSTDGVLARLDRIEKRIDDHRRRPRRRPGGRARGRPPPGPARPRRASPATPRPGRRAAGARADRRPAPEPAAAAEPGQPEPAGRARPPSGRLPEPAPRRRRRRRSRPPARRRAGRGAGARVAADAWSTYAGSGPTSSRPTKLRRRVTWIHLTQNARWSASTARP